MNALLRVAGVICMLVGIAVDAFGLTQHAKRREPAPARSAQPTVAGPYAPALTVGLYAQNDRYAATAALAQHDTVRVFVQTTFTERLTLGFDRPVQACTVESPGRVKRGVRVFPIAGVPGYSAIAFFSPAKRLTTGGNAAVCRLATPVSSARTDGDALAPIDPILRRHRLEYAAHAALTNAPGALYPAHDPPMKHVPLGVTASP